MRIVFLAVVLLGMGLLLLAVAPGCSRAPVTAVDVGQVNRAGGPIYRSGGIEVFRITGRPQVCAVRFTRVAYVERPGAKPRLLSFREAEAILADDAVVEPVSLWRTIPMRQAVGPGQLEKMLPGASEFAQASAGDEEPPIGEGEDPSPAEPIKKANPFCPDRCGSCTHRTWGCLKLCYSDRC